MIEAIIERWTGRDGHVDFISSLWRDGKREAMGRPHGTAEGAEGEALEICRRMFKCEPDRITRL
jgi:hypothetical protein